MAKRATYWIGDVPTHCQLSGREIKGIFVDGRVPGISSWAIMSPGTFRTAGGQTGTGLGQVYKQQGDGRWLKIEG